MTQDEIIRMAREAGLPCQHPDWIEAAERFAAIVAAHEREACANRQRAMDLLTQHSQAIGEYDDPIV